VTPPCIITEGTVFEDFTDDTDWTLDSGLSKALAWVSETVGKLSLRLALGTTGASGTTYYATKTISRDMSGDKSGIELACYASLNAAGPNGISKVTIEVSSTTDFSKSFKFQTVTNLHDGWNRIHVAESDWTNTGSESWSNTMLRLRVGLTPQWTGAAPSVYFDSLTGGVTTTPAVVLMFGNAKHGPLTALPALEDKGWKANLPIDLFSMDDADRMTAGEYEMLRNMGWELLGELAQLELLDPTWSHTAYTRYDGRIQHAVLDYYMTYAGYYGWGPFRFLLGVNSWRATAPEIHEVLAAHRILLTVRSSSGSENTANAMPFDAVYNLPVLFLGNTVTLATAEAAVDTAVARGGALFIEVEDLIPSPGAYDWTEDDYLDLLDYIDGKGITPKTMTEIWEFQSEEPVASTASVILGNMELNDQVNYFVDGTGVSTGQRQTVWEEAPSYASSVANAQVNVHHSGLVPVTIPMRVKGADLADLDTKLLDLWTEVDKQTNTLTIGIDESYNIVRSSRPVTIERDPLYQLGFHAYFTLVLMREP